MPVIRFPYGDGTVEYDFPAERFAGAAVSGLHGQAALADGRELICRALESPVGSPPLWQLARGKNRVVVLISDHTRPVPSKLILPPMLEQIRRGNPAAEVTLLVATGCHRGTTKGELAQKLGPDILARERIHVHDCDKDDMADCGMLPSGGRLLLNRLATSADLLVAEGFIEPHFFAGFSGGRKSVLPGVAGRASVLHNHNAAFIASPRARAGVLQGNPIHADMVHAARAAGLAFICNVVLGQGGRVVHAVAGHAEEAHRQGCEFLARHCGAALAPADIVVAGNGGYPLDQNIYQAVKGLSTAAMAVKKDGVIIMLAESRDGHGGQVFYDDFAGEKNMARLHQNILGIPTGQTRPDQWQSQILARVLQHARVIYVSALAEDLIRAFHMVPAPNIGQALALAEEMLQNPHAGILAIPDGVAVVVEPLPQGG